MHPHVPLQEMLKTFITRGRASHNSYSSTRLTYLIECHKPELLLDLSRTLFVLESTL